MVAAEWRFQGVKSVSIGGPRHAVSAATGAACGANRGMRARARPRPPGANKRLALKEAVVRQSRCGPSAQGVDLLLLTGRNAPDSLFELVHITGKLSVLFHSL